MKIEGSRDCYWAWQLGSTLPHCFMYLVFGATRELGYMLLGGAFLYTWGGIISAVTSVWEIIHLRDFQLSIRDFFDSCEGKAGPIV